MNIDRALEIVRAKDRRVPVPPDPHPEGATLWFRFSKRLRDFFKARLCPIGRATLAIAEADFARSGE